MVELVAEVLVVDDQGLVVEEVRARLTPHFGSVVGLESASEAVKRLMAGERYGVLLIDVMMQPISGLDLLRLASETDPHARVFMLTGDASAQTVIKAMRAGAVDYIVKPVDDWEAVIRSVRRALAERRLRDENARLFDEVKAHAAALERSVDLLRRLNKTAQLMHACRDVQQTVDLLVENVAEALEAERVSVMIRDPQDDRMAIYGATGVDDEVVHGIRMRPWEGVAGQVLASGEPAIVKDAAVDPRVPRDPDKDRRYTSKSFVCMPIALWVEGGPDRVLGVINVTNRRGDRPFSEAELEFTANLARQSAYALTNAALWKKRSKR